MEKARTHRPEVCVQIDESNDIFLDLVSILETNQRAVHTDGHDG